MGLAKALVDSGRRVRKTSAGYRVEGRTVYEDDIGTWFQVRLTIRRGTESLADGRQRVAKPSELLFGLLDTGGAEVVLHADDRVEVDSADFGRALWRLTNEPEPMRRRKGMIGWVADVERVEEPGAD